MQSIHRQTDWDLENTLVLLGLDPQLQGQDDGLWVQQAEGKVDSLGGTRPQNGQVSLAIEQLDTAVLIPGKACTKAR